MAYVVEILNDVEVDEPVFVSLETAVSLTLNHLKIPPAELSLLLTDDKRLQQLNLDFRQVDKATDVLSFPADESFPEFHELQKYLGDIAISVPFAQKQANVNGHSLISELQLLAVHGVLHLLGYDHVEQKEKKEMWSLQEQILANLGLHNIQPTED